MPSSSTGVDRWDHATLLWSEDSLVDPTVELIRETPTCAAEISHDRA